MSDGSSEPRKGQDRILTDTLEIEMRTEFADRNWMGMLIASFTVVAWLAAPAQGAGSVQYIKLGDVFTGSVAGPGDTVAAHFNAVQGTRATIIVAGLRSSSLKPALVLKDDSGNKLDLGSALVLRRKRAEIKNFEFPASGHYTLEISAISGAGDFKARTRARVPNKVNLITLSGIVTNSLTGSGISDATVAIGPFKVLTDTSGSYGEDVPVGDYSVSYTAQHFQPSSETITLLPRVDTTLDVALTPVTPVRVTAIVAGDAVPGASLTATANVEIFDGSTLESYAWAQANNVAVGIDPPDAASTTVTLPERMTFKEQVFLHLAEPPISEDQLPPNIHLPEGGFVGGIPNRFHLVSVDPYALEEAGLVVLKLTVTTSSGEYSDDAAVHTALPWRPATGVHNVPVGLPVLLHARDHVDEDGDGLNDETAADTTAYDWVLIPPDGSAAELVDPASQNPDFTPDVAGLYTLEVTDTTQAPGTDVITIATYAGTWRGVVTGQDENGRPLAEDCTGCHSGNFAPDKFTPWAQSGHAEIFTNNLNTSTHYGENCFACHTVGFEPGTDNGGIDEASDYGDFLAGGLLNNPGDNWTQVLSEFPNTAQLANIQCENCHGPQSSDAHRKGDSRIELGSGVCGSCHGEPLRHARFQQWQLSGHSNYELAVDEGDSGNCSRCHTANGFLAWLPVLLGDEPGDPTGNVTVSWSADETHPQTCVTCHDPHNPGSTTGINTNATVRISGDTPPLIAGFTAIGVGRGAMCMTCHNSRRGLRNDDTYDDIAGTSETARAPHGSAQADVLMGENAYLVETGLRGNHSFVTDSCVNCHMEQTAPPDLLSYNLGGTNHTFFASPEICSNCHGDAFDAEGVQSGVDANLAALESAIAEAMLALMTEQIDAGNSIDLGGQAVVEDPAEILGIAFGETRGRQAITVTLEGGATVGPLRVSDVDVVDPMANVLGMLYDFADARLIKSGWNWNLIHNDSSRGVHNPSFTFGVLDASIDALVALDSE
jgi:hypothetical protein